MMLSFWYHFERPWSSWLILQQGGKEHASFKHIKKFQENQVSYQKQEADYLNQKLEAERHLRAQA